MEDGLIDSSAYYSGVWLDCMRYQREMRTENVKVRYLQCLGITHAL
jgi:hypothetical protein